MISVRRRGSRPPKPTQAKRHWARAPSLPQPRGRDRLAKRITARSAPRDAVASRSRCSVPAPGAVAVDARAESDERRRTGPESAPGRPSAGPDPADGRVNIMFRWLTAGESHGRALAAICDGVPAGVRVTSEDVAQALARRRAGYGRGARMKFEQDEVELTGGVRHGVTLGGPVAIRVGNTEWPKWETVMSPDPVTQEDLDSQARNAPLTRPRPGHADLAGMQKFGHTDARPILERASARETAARVALGEVAKRVLDQALGVQDPLPRGVARRGRGAGRRAGAGTGRPGRASTQDPVRCADAATSAQDDRRGGRGPQGRRHPRRRGRGRGVRAAAGARQLHPVGPEARRAAGRRARLHPGDQGRGVRRRVHHRRPARLAARTTRSTSARTGCAGAPTGPAASRAACPPARCSGCGPR